MTRTNATQINYPPKQTILLQFRLMEHIKLVFEIFNNERMNMVNELTTIDFCGERKSQQGQLLMLVYVPYLHDLNCKIVCQDKVECLSKKAIYIPGSQIKQSLCTLF